jgi:hypothetical protein
MALQRKRPPLPGVDEPLFDVQRGTFTARGQQFFQMLLLALQEMHKALE